MDTDSAADLKDVISEIVHNLDKIAEHKQLIKDIVDAAHVELGIDKKILRKTANFYYKKTLITYESENNQIRELYDTITSK